MPDRVRFVQENLPRAMVSLILNLAPGLAVGVGSRFLAEDKLKKWIGDASGLQAVLRALPHNPSTMMDLDLWRVSRTLQARGAAPAADPPAVLAFLDQYGHRAVREIDLGMPRWRDDPTHVLNVLRTYLSHPDGEDPEAHFRAQAAAAEQWAMAVHRRVLQGAGAELVAAGRQDRADDVFFLDLADLVSDADLRAKAAANRAAYDREAGRRAVPRILTSEGEARYGAPAPVAGATTSGEASASPRVLAPAAIACPSGCSDPCSAPAARRKTSACSQPSAG